MATTSGQLRIAFKHRSSWKDGLRWLSRNEEAKQKGHPISGPFVFWWRRGGSNSRPSHCERDALPAELRPLHSRAEAVKFLRLLYCNQFRKNDSPRHEDRGTAGLRTDHAVAKEPQGGLAAHGGRGACRFPPAARDADQPCRIRAGQPRLSDRLRAVPMAARRSTRLSVLGLQSMQNLFILTDGTWDRRVYLPAYVRRYPFCMAKVTLDGEAQKERIVCVEASAVQDGGAAAVRRSRQHATAMECAGKADLRLRERPVARRDIVQTAGAA